MPNKSGGGQFVGKIVNKNKIVRLPDRTGTPIFGFEKVGEYFRSK